ncbi:MAG: hypothetical protein JZU47_08495 [Prolixibacteraceae bacterium]|jgi:hypothetical protein|nr:hypothetical protein [Prolixibacteraceae bacterium]
MKTKILALAVTSAFLFFSSCSKDEDVTPDNKVTFNDDIKPILKASCTPCHITGGSQSSKWDNYETVKGKISVILDRVNRAPGTPGFMPEGGSKLPLTEIATLSKWVTDGLLEK